MEKKNNPETIKAFIADVERVRNGEEPTLICNLIERDDGKKDFSIIFPDGKIDTIRGLEGLDDIKL